MKISSTITIGDEFGEMEFDEDAIEKLIREHKREREQKEREERENEYIHKLSHNIHEYILLPVQSLLRARFFINAHTHTYTTHTNERNSTSQRERERKRERQTDRQRERETYK